MGGVAGAPGFEPGNGGTKTRCLTTWLRPTTEVRSGAVLHGVFARGKCHMNGERVANEAGFHPSYVPRRERTTRAIMPCGTPERTQQLARRCTAPGPFPLGPFRPSRRRDDVGAGDTHTTSLRSRCPVTALRARSTPGGKCAGSDR